MSGGERRLVMALVDLLPTGEISLWFRFRVECIYLGHPYLNIFLLVLGHRGSRTSLDHIVLLTWSAIVNVAKHNVHLVEGLTLCLGEEEEGPDGGGDHPACEEEPCSVAEGLEDVGKSLGDGELSEPVTVSY